MSKSTIQALVKKPDDPEIRGRRLAAAALGEHGEAAVPFLIPRLRAKDPAGPSAVLALCNIGEVAMPALIEALETQELGVLGHAPSALGVLGGLNDGTARRVAEVLKSPNPIVRQGAAFALSQMGENGKAQLSALREAAKTETDDSAVKMIAYALSKLE